MAASVALLWEQPRSWCGACETQRGYEDAQLTQNASPLISFLMLALGALLVALVSALGIFWVATGHCIVGWGMICLAATGLAHVWVNVWIRRQTISVGPRSPGKCGRGSVSETVRLGSLYVR